MKKIGDVIEVHQIVAFGPDRWIGARVIAVHPNGDFDVEAIKGTFDGEHSLLALSADGQQHGAWR